MQTLIYLSVASVTSLLCYSYFTQSNSHLNSNELIEHEEPSVTRFRNYLKCKAVHPNPDYNSSISWIQSQAREIGLEYNVLQNGNKADEFVIWLTWRGRNESLKSILLNSHMDVVPVDIDKWTHDPFAAEKDENGNIWGRGTQDMKSVGVQYLEAIRNFKTRGMTPLRTVYISFVPDEETGGSKGMKWFVKSKEFQNLNIGFGLDEARARPDSKFTVGWAERAAWHLEFTATGKAGHGSIFHNNTAAEKIQKLINSFMDLRAREKKRMEDNHLELGAVTSINLTIMKGGTQVNVVPSQLTVSFDLRITPYWNLTYVQTLIDKVTAEAGSNVTYKFLHKNDIVAKTPLTDDNIWWQIMKRVAVENQFELAPVIHPGATDIRYLRDVGIPAFGFSPMNNTPTLLHDHNEFLNENTFLRGILVYEQILNEIINLPASATL